MATPCPMWIISPPAEPCNSRLAARPPKAFPSAYRHEHQFRSRELPGELVESQRWRANRSPGTTQIGIISDISGFNFPTNAYVAKDERNIVITVDRVNPNTGDVTVNFSTTNIPGLNNGIANVDYIATNGTLFFQNGQATNSFTVQILDPNIVEPVKSFSVAFVTAFRNSCISRLTPWYILPMFLPVSASFGGSSFSEKECEAPVPIR